MLSSLWQGPVELCCAALCCAALRCAVEFCKLVGELCCPLLRVVDLCCALLRVVELCCAALYSVPRVAVRRRCETQRWKRCRARALSSPGARRDWDSISVQLGAIVNPVRRLKVRV